MRKDGYLEQSGISYCEQGLYVELAQDVQRIVVLFRLNSLCGAPKQANRLPSDVNFPMPETANKSHKRSRKVPSFRILTLPFYAIGR